MAPASAPLIESRPSSIPNNPIARENLPMGDRNFLSIQKATMPPEVGNMPALRIQGNLDEHHIFSAHLADKKEGERPISRIEILQLNKEGNAFAEGDFVDSSHLVDADGLIGKTCGDLNISEGSPEGELVVSEIASSLHDTAREELRRIEREGGTSGELLTIDKQMLRWRIKNELTQLREKEFREKIQKKSSVELEAGSENFIQKLRDRFSK